MEAGSSPPPIGPGGGTPLTAHTDSAAVRLLLGDACARAWLLPPHGAGVGLTLTGAALRASVAVDKRVQVEGGLARDIKLQFLFCPLSSVNGRTLGIVEARSSATVTAGPLASNLLLPPSRSRFLMDETTREVVVVGWADARMGTHFPFLRSLPLAEASVGTPAVFTMSFSSHLQTARRRRAMLVLASPPALGQLPDMVLHRVDAEEIATRPTPIAPGATAAASAAGGGLAPDAAPGGAAPRVPPPRCSTPDLQRVAAEVFGGAAASPSLTALVDDDLPMLSPLPSTPPSPLCGLPGGLPSPSLSFGSLGAELGLPPSLGSPSPSLSEATGEPQGGTGEDSARARDSGSGSGSGNGSGSGSGSGSRSGSRTSICIDSVSTDSGRGTSWTATAVAPGGVTPGGGAPPAYVPPPPFPASRASSGRSSFVNPANFDGFAAVLLDLLGSSSAPVGAGRLAPDDQTVSVSNILSARPMDTTTAILVATVPHGPAVVRVTPGGFCIVRGLGVPGGISGRSPVLSAIGLAQPDVRDALKVGLVQALLDEAATPVYPPLGCAGGGLAGLGGGGGMAVGMVGAACSAGGGGWQPRPALGCLPPGVASGAAAAGQPLMLYPAGVGGAWLDPPGGRAGVAAASAAAVGVVGGGIARRRGVPSRRPRADGGAAAEEPLLLDPNSAAYQRKVRNRLSAARSNEKRRLRRLAAKAEAAAVAATAAAGEGAATSAAMAGASVAAAVAGGTAARTSSAGLPGVGESSGTPA